MTQNNNILQELKDLKSSLAGLAAQNIYSVPNGYFEGLAGQVINRIKAMEAANATEELGYLSPMLSNISKQMPYTVPAGYFEGLEKKLIPSVRESNDYLQMEPFGQTATEELESISPLLSGLKKQTPVRPGHPGGPYTVPQGYFENLAADIRTQGNKQETKVVSIGSRKWFRYAAAAIITGVIVMAGFIFIKNDKVDAGTNSHAWVEKKLKKVSTEKIEEFIQLTDEEKSIVITDNKTQEVKELMKDVPENEIQSFLIDTELLDDIDINPASDETMMN
jgi:hypothetical protein